MFLRSARFLKWFEDDPKKVDTVQTELVFQSCGLGERDVIDIAAVVDAAGAARADALHPGFGFLAENGTDHFETMFACWKLGAIFVPLNWRLTAHETAAILDHCEPRVVLHDCGHAGPVQFTCTHCGGAADPTNTRVPRNRLTRPTRSPRT